MLLYAAILLPVAAGAVLPLLRCENGKQRAVYVSAVTLSASLLTVLTLLWERDAPHIAAEILPGLRLAFAADGKSAVFAGLVSALWPLSTLYGFAYMEHEEREDRFFAWYCVSQGVTVAAAFAGNLFTLYLCYELLTLSTLPLVNHKDDAPSRRAGLQYAAWTVGGAALGFVALVGLLPYGGGESFRTGGILALPAGDLPDALPWLYMAAFLGFGVKAAVAPFCAWLPAASVAPTPVTALLHAVAVVNTGAFAVMRVTDDVFGGELLFGAWPQTAALLISCATILFGACMAVRERHLKRRLAWSTVSNLSYMLMGAALMTPAGIAGAMAHLVCHGLMKIVLFFCAGAFLVKTGKEYVQDLRGFGKVMPVTCACFAFAAVALTGTPPLCGFFSKWRLLTAAAAAGLPMGIAAVAVIIAAAVLTAVYVLSPVQAMYFRPPNEGGALPEGAGDPDLRMLAPIGIICAAVAVFGAAGYAILG